MNSGLLVTGSILTLKMSCPGKILSPGKTLMVGHLGFKILIYILSICLRPLVGCNISFPEFF